MSVLRLVLVGARSLHGLRASKPVILPPLGTWVEGLLGGAP